VRVLLTLHILSARLKKILSLGCLTTVILKEVWNYFARKLLCMIASFVNDK
jgi:hypothetical protein